VICYAPARYLLCSSICVSVADADFGAYNQGRARYVIQRVITYPALPSGPVRRSAAASGSHASTRLSHFCTSERWVERTGIEPLTYFVRLARLRVSQRDLGYRRSLR
jgi:hypothetical protein